ncbi:MAG TPA: D-alanyl-D-alanine carboxypeptidase [Pyrinomonadaceae bacterium]|jgi:D-alanyl-D-alanine carboxypeptidase/D-alanyl-D-alanine-endopeptidase (penicillin-binding protein 4)
MQNQATFANIFFAALLLFVAPGLLLAQTPAKEQGTPPNVAAPQPSPTSADAEGDQASPTVYGLQGVLIETLDGKIVSSQAADQRLNPASSVKLATALIALRTFGPNHRFTTGFWTDGAFDKTNGQILGNLYVTGRDPSFHLEHAIMIAQQLNGLGIRTVTGDLIVATGFTMNFNSSARSSGTLLRDTLDSTLRSSEAMSAWTYERTALGDQSSLQVVPSLAVQGDVYVGSVPPGTRLLLTHKSSKLTDVLKVLLCYSNNFMAERIGDSLGGKESVMRQLVMLGIPREEVQLASLSGLGVNRVTPHAMMKILRALRAELQKNKLTPADIMPVAGIDPGTLEDRFTGPAWQGSVIAKTGTLVRTDGGASSLVGQMRTVNGGTLLFVIMNQRGNVLRFRSNQDYLVMLVQNSRGGPKAFNYKPLILPMKLADTESVSSLTNLEREPNLKGPSSSP